MKNSGTDYFAQLRSDYIAPKKNSYDNDRRPYNRDNPNEFQFIPATAQAVTDEVSNTSFSAGKLLPVKIILS